MNTTKTFCLRVRGHLDVAWSEWFDGLTIAHEPNGETTLTGTVQDHAALYGLLAKARDLGLELVAVVPISLEGGIKPNEDETDHRRARLD
jgi:hypothetical protein